MRVLAKPPKMPPPHADTTDTDRRRYSDIYEGVLSLAGEIDTVAKARRLLQHCGHCYASDARLTEEMAEVLPAWAPPLSFVDLLALAAAHTRRLCPPPAAAEGEAGVVGVGAGSGGGAPDVTDMFEYLTARELLLPPRTPVSTASSPVSEGGDGRRPLADQEANGAVRRMPPRTLRPLTHGSGSGGGGAPAAAVSEATLQGVVSDFGLLFDVPAALRSVGVGRGESGGDGGGGGGGTVTQASLRLLCGSLGEGQTGAPSGLVSSGVAAGNGGAADCGGAAAGGGGGGGGVSRVSVSAAALSSKAVPAEAAASKPVVPLSAAKVATPRGGGGAGASASSAAAMLQRLREMRRPNAASAAAAAARQEAAEKPSVRMGHTQVWKRSTRSGSAHSRSGGGTDGRGGQRSEMTARGVFPPSAPRGKLHGVGPPASGDYRAWQLRMNLLALPASSNVYQAPPPHQDPILRYPSKGAPGRGMLSAPHLAPVPMICSLGSVRGAEGAVSMALPPEPPSHSLLYPRPKFLL